MGRVAINEGVSPIKSFTIGNGADGSAVAAVDLGAQYQLLSIRCEDCSNIAADTTPSLKVGNGADDTLCDLYKFDTPGTKWGDSQTLPTTGTWHALIPDAIFARRLQIILSNNASGGSVVFKVQGIGEIQSG